MFQAMCRMPPESAAVIPKSGPLRELSVICGIFGDFNIANGIFCMNGVCNCMSGSCSGRMLDETALTHVCELCTRGFSTAKDLQQHQHQHCRLNVFREDYERRREARTVAHGRVRTAQASVDQLVNNDSATQLRAEMAVMKSDYEAKLSDALAGPKASNDINLEALQDCYARMVCVPDVKALMDELGVERAEDLTELDKSDILVLAEPLKKVPKNKLLRVLDICLE